MTHTGICTELQDRYRCSLNVSYMKRIHKEASKQEYHGVSCPLNRSKMKAYLRGFGYLLREMPGEF